MVILLMLTTPAFAQNSMDPTQPSPTVEEDGSKNLPHPVIKGKDGKEVIPLGSTAGMIYAVSSTTLYLINQTTGSSTYIGNTGYSGLLDVSYDGSQIHATTATSFLAINPSTGQATWISNTGYQINSLVAALDGYLYAASTTGAFLRINKSTGGITYIGDLGVMSSGDLAFVGNRLFLSVDGTPNQLAEVNLSSGSATIIGSIGYSAVFGLATVDNYLYGVTSTGQFLWINTSTGAGTLIGYSSISMMGMASAPSVVLPHDDFDQAYPIPEDQPPANGLSYQIVELDAWAATVAPDDPDMGCGYSVNSNTLWYRFTPRYFGSFRVRTFNELNPAADSDYDTVLAVFTGQRSNLDLITCNDDADGRLQSEMVFNVKPGVTYYIEAAAYGPTPSANILSLFFNYMVSPKAWTLMFYTAADSDGDQEARLRAQYDRLPGLANNLHTNIVGLWDDRTSQGRYDAFTPWGVISQYLGELNTDSASTLINFMQWAVTNYPAEHYALIISDHGHGAGGVAYDYNNGEPVNHFLSPTEIRQALADASTPYLDVLYMDACLMATLEAAYQARGYAQIYVASEAITWGSIRPDYFINGHDEIPYLSNQTSPAELGISMARSYAAEHAYSGSPSNISVVDLSQVGGVAAQTSTLAGAIRAKMIDYKSTLEQIRIDVQHFEDDGNMIIDDHDRLIDLYHFASLISSRISDYSIRNAANTLISALDNYVLFELHWSGFWLHNDSHGVSILFPNPEKRECYYNGDWLDFAGGAYWQCSLLQQESSRAATDLFEWGPMLVDFTLLTNPLAYENYDPPALVAPIVISTPSLFHTYLPQINGMPTAQNYSANVFSMAADGELGNISCTNWLTCRNSITGNFLMNGYAQGTVDSSWVSSQFSIKRIFLFFDTSSIPTNATITGVVLHVYADQFLAGNTTLYIVNSTAPIPLTNDAFNKVSYVPGGSYTASGNSWMNISLNNTGMMWIIKGGITKLALLHQNDLLNSAPLSANNVLVGLFESSQDKPYLTINYSLP